MVGPRMRQINLGKMTLGSFFYTLLSLELVWFWCLSDDWVLVLWLGSCLKVGFLSYDMGSCLMIWILVL